MMRMAVPAWSLLLSMLPACGETIDRCQEPVDGSRSDVTLTFENPSGFTAAECTKSGRLSDGMFRVQGTASARLFGDRAPGDMSQATDFERLIR